MIDRLDDLAHEAARRADIGPLRLKDEEQASVRGGHDDEESAERHVRRQLSALPREPGVIGINLLRRDRVDDKAHVEIVFRARALVSLPLVGSSHELRGAEARVKLA